MAASDVGLVPWGLGCEGLAAWVPYARGSLCLGGNFRAGLLHSRWGPVQLGGRCLLLEPVPDMENCKCPQMVPLPRLGNVLISPQWPLCSGGHQALGPHFGALT